MKLFCSVPCWVLTVFCVDIVIGNPVDELWEEYKKVFGKTYATQADDEAAKAIFEENLTNVVKHNMNGTNAYIKGLNQYSDMKPKDAIKMLTGFKPNANVSTVPDVHIQTLRKTRDLPESVDWVAWGAVTPVKDQGSCGACTQFAITQSIEGQMAIQFGQDKLEELSVQQSIDCNPEFPNCGGGNNEKDFQNLINMGGVQSEQCYPLVGQYQDCAFQEGECIQVKVTSYVRIGEDPWGDEQLTASALAEYGPLAIGVHVTDNFLSYSNGIFSDPQCDQPINHALLLVGYGEDNGVHYWVLKNSWGTGWGDNGYMKLLRDGNNMCMVATDVSYPIIAEP